MPIARLGYTTTRDEWTRYSHDRHGHFHRYLFIRPSPSVDALLAEIEADSTNIFGG